MFKNFYIVAWLILIGTIVSSVIEGSFGVAKAIAVSVGAVGLVYGFALWAVMNVTDQRSSS